MKTCSIEDCWSPVKGYGYCNKHYQLFKRNGKPEKLIKTARSHPLYIIWFEKKQNNRLCEEWMIFKNFCEGVGQRPEGNFVLKRPDPNNLYSPNNFEWYEHLKKEENETDKDWWARKWANRRHRNPDTEYDRNLQRSFGIGLNDYLEKFKNQNGVCAICCKEETSKSQSGTLRRLAVDHCHLTGKVRDLLCTRCNKTIGMAEDNTELLQEMINYLNKHKETN